SHTQGISRRSLSVRPREDNRGRPPITGTVPGGLVAACDIAAIEGFCIPVATLVRVCAMALLPIAWRLPVLCGR
ncbi:MAG: hypothetical protein WA996_19830, partial [Candidatus Promineifilaceae bacterium]